MPSAVKTSQPSRRETITKKEVSKKGKHSVKEAKIREYLKENMVTVSKEKQYKETGFYLLEENVIQMFSGRNMILKVSKFCGWNL